MNWAGALLLVVSAYFCGRKIAAREGDSLKALDSLALLLEFTQRRMQTSQKPLCSIFSDFNDSYLESMGFLQIIRSCRWGLGDAWESAISLLPLEQDIKCELLHFGSELGNLSLEDQLKSMAVCMDAVKKARDDLRSSLPSKQKSIRTVSLLFGTLAAIILI